MNKDKRALIDALLKKIKQCESTLEKISTTCCMPIRSKKMQDTFLGFNHLSSLLKAANQESMKSSLAVIEQFGSQIGKLYVTCCTEKREPLYQQLLKQLNGIHTNIHKIMGTAH